MSDKLPSDRIFTIPNLVSFGRAATVPVFWWVLIGRDDIPMAAAIVFVIGLTDWVDGYLARRLDQVSRLGTILDPVADRLMIASAVVGGLIADVVPEIIGYPLIAREAFVGLVTLVMVRNGAGVLTVRYLGKFATFALYGAIPSFYLAAADFLTPITQPFAWFSGTLGLVAYLAVAILYVGDARSAIAAVESRPAPEES